MINPDRIVPVQRIDLLSLVGVIMAMNGASYTVAKSKDIEGTFEVSGTGSVGNVLCDQPAKSIDLKDGVTAATVYFIPDYEFSGVSLAGTAVTPAMGSDEVQPDGRSIYKAVLATNAVTITAITPME